MCGLPTIAFAAYSGTLRISSACCYTGLDTLQQGITGTETGFKEFLYSVFIYDQSFEIRIFQNTKGTERDETTGYRRLSTFTIINQQH